MSDTPYTEDSSTRPALVQLFDKAYDWYHTKLHQFSVISSSNQQTFRYDVSDEELNDIHPDFADNLHALLDNHGRVNGRLIDAQRLLLLNEVMTVTDIDNQERQFSSVMQFKTVDESAWLMGDVISIAEYAYKRETYKIVTSRRARGFEVDTFELDFACPGWKERQVIGESIVLNIVELHHYMFFTTGIEPPNVALPTDMEP